MIDEQLGIVDYIIQDDNIMAKPRILNLVLEEDEHILAITAIILAASKLYMISFGIIVVMTSYLL